MVKPEGTKNRGLVPILFHLFAFTLVLGVYHSTMARGLVEVDSGELAAVACTNGVGHPTGYSLYTLLAFLWSRLPLFPTVIYGLNFFSCVCVALSVNVVLAGVVKLLRRGLGEASALYVYTLGLVAALSYAFFGLVWRQSVSVEVYAFQLLLMGLVLYSIICVYAEPDRAGSRYFLGLFLGLALGHHLLGVFLLPGVSVFLVWQYKGRLEPILSVVGISLGCLLLQYGYLYLHATWNPQLNWGDPSSLGRLVRHVSGGQYRSSMFSLDRYRETVALFWEDMPKGVGYVSLLPALAGFGYGFIKDRKLTVSLLMVGLPVLFLVPLYAIRDIGNYFLPFYAVLPYGMALGLVYMARFAPRLVLGFVLLPLGTYFMNRDAVDRSGDGYITQYTGLFFDRMPPNALYIGYAWDILISPTYYCQYCENTRRDVDVVDKSLLMQPWYYGQLDLDLFVGIEPENDRLPGEWEAMGGDFAPSGISGFLTRFIEANMERRPVFLSFEIFKNNLGKDVILPPQTMLVPRRFGFEVIKGNEYMPLGRYEEPEIDFNGKDDFYTRLIVEDRVNLWVARCLYELQYGQMAKAQKCVSLLRSNYPDHPNTRKLMGMVNDSRTP